MGYKEREGKAKENVNEEGYMILLKNEVFVVFGVCCEYGYTIFFEMEDKPDVP